MKIAITGATGMLGRALCQVLEGRHSVYPFASQTLDVTSAQGVLSAMAEINPDWIIHAAAYTRVDEAEVNSVEAHRVNTLGTRNMAVAAYQNRSALLYYSSDYVFDGKLGRPYREWDTPNPLNEYGRSKLAGEFFVRALCPAHLIVRTSWLFGPRGKRSAPHFVDKILTRVQGAPRLDVVTDQRGSPTFAPDLARMTLCLLEDAARGTYHITNSGQCSWYEFAKEILALKKLDVEIAPTHSSRLNSPAQRPAFSVLENYLLRLENIPLLRSWNDALAEFLRET